MIVLDTHALIWWVSDDSQLSDRARSELTRESEDVKGQILVSAITPWEIAMLQKKGRLVLAMAIDEWLLAVESLDRLTVVPVTARTAVASVSLPGDFHKDPADRFIVALAREMNAPLLTADGKIHDYPHVRTVW